jgi:sugar lactone lactonase YvrE
MMRSAPTRALPGARVALTGTFFSRADTAPVVMVGSHEARVVSASPRLIRFVVPTDVEGGRMSVHVNGLAGESTDIDVAKPFVTGIHQVDSPVFDADGRLYVTHSGARDTKVGVPLFLVSRDGTREPLPVSIANPTSLAIGPDGDLYVSSRFEGTVYRLTFDRRTEVYASELGVPTGLAFGPDGALYVGDRSGSIFRVSPHRQVETFASLPASVAAFHLAFGPDGCLYVTAPTLATHDALYRITPDRLVDVVTDRFGRPQGLAFDANGTLFVVDALAGSAGLYRVDVSTRGVIPELVVGAASLVGVAFGPTGELALAAGDTVWLL